MKTTHIYSNTFLNIIRFSGILAATLLTISIIYRIIDFNIIAEQIGYNEAIFVIIQNTLLTIPCIVLAIFPEHLEIISLLSLLFALSCNFDYCNPMAPLMFMLSVSTLAYRGMYHNHKRFKFILTALLTIFIFFVDFRFGLKKGFASFTTKMAYSFVTGLSIIFASQFYSHSQKTNRKVLVISKYPELTKRDCEWLNKIKDGMKYDAIAIEDGLASSTVKNRLREIYKIIECGDRPGFVSLYRDWEVIFNEDNKTDSE